MYAALLCRSLDFGWRFEKKRGVSRVPYLGWRDKMSNMAMSPLIRMSGLLWDYIVLVIWWIRFLDHQAIIRGNRSRHSAIISNY